MLFRGERSGIVFSLSCFVLEPFSPTSERGFPYPQSVTPSSYWNIFKYFCVLITASLLCSQEKNLMLIDTIGILIVLNAIGIVVIELLVGYMFHD